jgi:hypothetical protein
MGVAQDPSPPPPGGLDESRPYTELEEHALSLAGELRERVQRERETVARLQAHLTGGKRQFRRKPAEE